MKNKMLLPVMIVCVLASGMYTFAQDRKTESKGMLEIEEKIYFYGEDIEYLEEEIKKLATECKQEGI